jgi:hypothetical protein
MDLKTFVSTTLTQILEGVKQAQQSGPLGPNVAAETFNSQGTHLYTEGTLGTFTVVEFDVSVIAETREGGGSIKISSVETTDTSSKSAQNASRVKFAVHMKLPPGAKSAVHGGGNTRLRDDYHPFDN